MSARKEGRLGPGAQVQQLHLVGVTTDHASLIFSVRKGAKSGSFVLPLDEQLLGSLADAVRRRNADGTDLELPIEIDGPAPTPRRQSQLSPREIQDRLRAGRSLDEIAAEAGVGEEWIARFAAPIEAERSQIVNRARHLVYNKARRGDSGEPLGLSVRWNLAERGLRMTNDEFDAAWSGYQLNDQSWMVTFAFVSRKRAQQAEWEVDLGTGQLFSRNRLASDLGYTEPGRRRRSVTALQPVARRGAAKAADPASAAEPRNSPAPAKRAAKKATRTTAAPRKATAARKSTSSRSKPGAASAKSGVPPASPPPPPPAQRPPVPNELGQRRLQIIASAADRPGPAPRRGGRPLPPVAGRRRPDPFRPPPREPRATVDAPRASQVEALDVAEAGAAPDKDDAAEARRLERRRARAERAGTALVGDTAGDAGEGNSQPSGQRSSRLDLPAGDGRVVTIRANRATPPGEGEVVLPGNPPPLRPAMPAKQPRRLRFGRNSR